MNAKTVAHVDKAIGNVTLSGRPSFVYTDSFFNNLKVQPRYRFTDDASVYLGNRTSSGLPSGGSSGSFGGGGGGYAGTYALLTEGGDNLQTEAEDFLEQEH